MLRAHAPPFELISRADMQKMALSLVLGCRMIDDSCRLVHEERRGESGQMQPQRSTRQIIDGQLVLRGGRKRSHPVCSLTGEDQVCDEGGGESISGAERCATSRLEGSADALTNLAAGAKGLGSLPLLLQLRRARRMTH